MLSFITKMVLGLFSYNARAEWLSGIWEGPLKPRLRYESNAILDSGSPFCLFNVGEVQKEDKEYHLRRYPDVFWVIKNNEHTPCVGTRHVWVDGKINEYPLTEHEIAEFGIYLDYSQGVQKLRAKKIKEIKAPLKYFKPVDFNPNEAIAVGFHEYALTQADSKQPILGIFKAENEIILALYDELNKVAVMAQIDMFTSSSSLLQLVDLVSKNHTVAHLLGGGLFDKDRCADIVQLFQKNNIRIMNADIIKAQGTKTSLAIDARTGVIYAPIEISQLKIDANFQARIQAERLKINLLAGGLPRCPSLLSKSYDGFSEIQKHIKSVIMSPKKQYITKAVKSPDSVKIKHKKSI